jgi:hypothetical protein
MKLSVLLGGLHNPNPAVRLDVVRVLGMLDETRALEPLRERYHQETDESVQQAITWAGKRLFQAHQAGYSTIDEIFRFFAIDKDIEHAPDDEEAKLMEQMELNLQRDLIKIREKGARGKVGWAIGVGAVAGLGAGLGALMSPGAESLSSGLEQRPQIGTTRTPATAPTDADISVWLRRLNESSDPDMREQAIMQLAELNNPRALPHLAATFVNDPEPQIRQAAQRFGKILYWRATYWTMEQDGSLEAEMQRRAEAIGGTVKHRELSPVDTQTLAAVSPLESAPRPGSKPKPKEEEVDVGEILRQAQERRAKRQSKSKSRSSRRKSRGRR